MMFLQANSWFIDNWQGLLAVLLLLGAAALVLRSRAREETHKTDTANVASLNALLATRDKELAVKEAIIASKAKELETVTSEYKQVVQINITEMVNAWQKHISAQYMIENASLRLRNEELAVRLAQHEKV